MFRLFIPKD